MFYFPSIFFLLMGFLIPTNKTKWLFFGLFFFNIFSNIYYGWWSADVYTTGTFILLCMLNPYFIDWWKHRLDPTSPMNLNMKSPNKNLIKQYRITIVIFAVTFALLFCIASYLSESFEDNQNIILSSCLIIAMIVAAIYIFIAKLNGKLVNPDVNAPPAVKDKKLSYVFNVLFAAWPIGYLIYYVLNIHFILPTILVLILCVLLSLFIKDSTRYLIPGVVVLLADFGWRLINIFFYASSVPLTYIISEIVLAIAILAGVIWLLKKPGYSPILFLGAIVLFRYIMVMHHLFSQLSTFYTVKQDIMVGSFLTCWVLLAPIILWLVGFKSVRSLNI